MGHFVLMALCRGPGIWVSSRPDYTRDPARAYRASRWCIRDSGAHATGLKSKVSPCPGGPYFRPPRPDSGGGGPGSARGAPVPARFRSPLAGKPGSGLVDMHMLPALSKQALSLI